MITRRIITIDAAACTGCGDCVVACHEGAIGMQDGKAVLLRDDYCDGLGDCLPACPANAIHFEEREALPYDEAAVLARQAALKAQADVCPAGGCPGSAARTLAPRMPLEAGGGAGGASYLRNWPVQLRLVPANASFLAGADLLVAADCAAYAHADFQRAFMAGKVTLIACPKLDTADYAAKLRDILTQSAPRSITLVRMRVPCCGGLAQAAATAVAGTGGKMPLRVVVLDTDGTVCHLEGQG